MAACGSPDRSSGYQTAQSAVSDSAIGVLPKHEVLRIFPKQVLTSKSSMILKGPKTQDSHRKQYLTTPLLAWEIGAD